MTIDENNREHTPHGGPRAGRRITRWIVVAGLGLTAAGGLGVAGAVSDDFRGNALMAHMGRGGGHGMRAHESGMGFGGSAIGRALRQLDLSDEQEDRIWEIMDGVRRDARPLFREMHDTREELARLLGAATIDRAAVEKLRADRVAEVDEASKKLVTALTDAAEVLTPEQRSKVAEDLGDRGFRRGRW